MVPTVTSVSMQSILPTEVPLSQTPASLKEWLHALGETALSLFFVVIHAYYEEGFFPLPCHHILTLGAMRSILPFYFSWSDLSVCLRNVKGMGKGEEGMLRT